MTPDDYRPIDSKSDSAQSPIPVAKPAFSPGAKVRLWRETLRLVAPVAGWCSDSAGEVLRLEFKKARLFETIARVQLEQHNVKVDAWAQAAELHAYATAYIPGYAAATTAQDISNLEEGFKGRSNAGQVEALALPPVQPTMSVIEEGIVRRAAALSLPQREGRDPLLTPDPDAERWAPVLSWPSSASTSINTPASSSESANTPKAKLSNTRKN